MSNMNAITSFFSRIYFHRGPKPRQYNSPYIGFGLKDIYYDYGMGQGKGFVFQISEESISLYLNNRNCFGGLGNKIIEIKRIGFVWKRFCFKHKIFQNKLVD